MRALLAAISFVILCGFSIFHGGGCSGCGGGGSGAVLSVQSNAYVAAANSPGTTIGTLSTTCSASCGTPAYSWVSSGTDYAGQVCQSVDFQINSSTGVFAEKASGGDPLGTYYPCVQSAGSAGTMVQRITVQIGTNAIAVGHQVYGDQVAVQSGQNYPTYSTLVAAENGKVVTNRSASGVRACDAALSQVINTSTPTVQTSENPLATLEFGGVEANTMGTGAYETAFKNCLGAEIAWLATPGKTLGSSGTEGGGGWSAYSGYSGAVQSATVGNTLTFSVNAVAGYPGLDSCPSGSDYCTSHVFVWYTNFSGSNTGTFTYAVDGGSATTVTPYSDSGATQGVSLLDIPNLTTGSHSVVLTIASIGGSQGIAFIAAGTPPSTYATKIMVAGVLQEQSNANAAATTAYDKDVADEVAAMAADQIDVLYVPVRSYVVNSTDMASQLVPNASGQIHIAEAFQGRIPQCLTGHALPSYVSSGLQGLATCLSFDDEGTSLSTVDTGNTGAFGYNWYLNGVWPRAAQIPGWRNAACSGGGNYPPLPASWITQGSGGITLTPGCTPSVVNQAFLDSCGSPSNSPTTPPYIVDKAVLGGGQGFYFEGQLSWTGSGQYTLWSVSREFHDYTSATTFTPSLWAPEIDNPDQGFDEYDVVSWVASSNGADAMGPNYSSSSGVSPTSGATAGTAVESNLLAGSGPLIAYFFNGAAEATSNSASGTIASTTHPCILLSQAAGSTATFRYVRLWQQPI